MSTTSAPAIVESIVAKPATMAAHDKLVIDEADEYEYVPLTGSRKGSGTDTDRIDSYESLPPNFSLAANMAAGAFAGIAVCCA